MRFGVQTPQLGVEAGELLDFWRFLDRETRFESLWLMDHLLPPADELEPDVPCLESWTLLAAAAVATERLRLGCLVSANTFRHPALLAKMAATVDHLSAGRLVLGIGAGWFEAEHRAFGIPLPEMRERQDRLEESAALLRAIFEAEKRVRFHGAYYELLDAPFSPRFVQEPHPPLLIGGSGERRTLRTVARFADQANLTGPLSVVAKKLGVLRRHCDAVGRDYATLEKTIHVPLFAHEEPAVVETAIALIAAHFALPPEQVRSELPVGSPEHVCEVLAHFARLGISAIYFPTIPPWSRDAFARLSETVVAQMDERGA
jgi:F420-dependent oxidoreductase-like protein